MEKQQKTRIFHSLSLVFNLTIIAMVIYSISAFFTVGGMGNMGVIGVECFRFFTNLSNMLAAATALILIPFNVMSIVKGEDKLPKWALICKFAGTVSVSVTFLTVLFFLGPTMGFELMFAGPCLYLHALVPVLAILSFVLFEIKHEICFKLSFVGLAPTVIYSIVYLCTVVFAKVWPDFYGFTFGGKMWAVPISMIVMYVATYAICVGLWALHNLCTKKLLKQLSPQTEKENDQTHA